MKARPRESIDVIHVGRDSTVMNTEGWGPEVFFTKSTIHRASFYDWGFSWKKNVGPKNSSDHINAVRKFFGIDLSSYGLNCAPRKLHTWIHEHAVINREKKMNWQTPRVYLYGLAEVSRSPVWISCSIRGKRRKDCKRSFIIGDLLPGDSNFRPPTGKIEKIKSLKKKNY